MPKPILKPWRTMKTREQMPKPLAVQDEDAGAEEAETA